MEKKVLGKCRIKRDFTLLANSSQRQQNNITPVHGLLFIPFLTELPPEGTVQQKGDQGNKSRTDQPHSTAEGQNKDVRREGEGWTAKEKGTPARESGTCDLGYVQERGVSSCGYKVKTLVGCPRFSDHRIRLRIEWTAV